MSETFKIADVEYTIHSKEVVQNVGGEFGMNAKRFISYSKRDSKK